MPHHICQQTQDGAIIIGEDSRIRYQFRLKRVGEVIELEHWEAEDVEQEVAAKRQVKRDNKKKLRDYKLMAFNPCQNRSEKHVRVAKCASCSGEKNARVYGCRVFGECTIGDARPEDVGARCVLPTGICTEYMPSFTDEDGQSPLHPPEDGNGTKGKEAHHDLPTMGRR